MTKYDKENLELLKKELEKKLEKVKSVPENAILIYTNQGENIVGYETPDKKRIYF